MIANGRPGVDLTLTSIGSLVVLQRCDRPEGKRYRGWWWLVRCGCGVEWAVPSTHLVPSKARPSPTQACQSCANSAEGVDTFDRRRANPVQLERRPSARGRSLSVPWRDAKPFDPTALRRRHG